MPGADGITYNARIGDSAIDWWADHVEPAVTIKHPHADHTFGRIYHQKAVSVGVIVHSRSVVTGHGSGVTTLFTSKAGLIEPIVDTGANLKFLFEKMESLNV